MGTQVISIVLLASLRHNVSFSLTNCNHVHGSVLVLHFGEQKMPSQLFMQGRMAVLPARVGGMHEAPSHTGAQTAWCFVYLYYTYLYYICIVFVLYLYYICIIFVLHLYYICIVLLLYLYYITNGGTNCLRKCVQNKLVQPKIFVCPF